MPCRPILFPHTLRNITGTSFPFLYQTRSILWFYQSPTGLQDNGSCRSLHSFGDREKRQRRPFSDLSREGRGGRRNDRVSNQELPDVINNTELHSPPPPPNRNPCDQSPAASSSSITPEDPDTVQYDPTKFDDQVTYSQSRRIRHALSAPFDGPGKSDHTAYAKFSPVHPEPTKILAKESLKTKSKPKKSPDSSTITSAERVIFDNIFRDIAQSIPHHGQQQQQQRSQDAGSTEPLPRQQPERDVETILASAIPQKKADRMKSVTRTKEAISRYPPSLREAAMEASSGFSWKMSRDHDIQASEKDGLEEEDETLDAATRKVQQDIEEAIELELHEAAKESDYAIWKVLEAKVFPMIEQLGLDEESESGSSADLGITIEQQSKLIKNSKKREPSSKAKSTQETETANRDLSSPTLFDVQPLKDPNLPDIPLLAIVVALYPSLLLTAIRLLSAHYPSSPICLHLLPHIKSLGPTSYVLGATTSLYNELLSLRWRVYADFSSMNLLLSEMSENGVMFNMATVKILDGIETERTEVLSGEGDSAAKLWWIRKGTQAQYRRLVGNERYGWRSLILQDIRRKKEARKQRRWWRHWLLAGDNEIASDLGERGIDDSLDSRNEWPGRGYDGDIDKDGEESLEKDVTRDDQPPVIL